MKSSIPVSSTVILLIVSLSILQISSGEAATFTVLQGESIQAAVDAASPGDLILVQNGTYIESIDIYKPLMLKGTGLPVIDAGAKEITVMITGGGSMLEGFEVSKGSDSGIWVLSNNNTIRNNTVRGNGAGIILTSSMNNTISGNTLEDNILGIGIIGTDREYISSWLLLRVEGVTARIKADPEMILVEEFDAVSAMQIDDDYIVEIEGRVQEGMAEDMGYPGAKIAIKDNSSIIAISSSPEYITANYLERALGVDVVSVGVGVYEIRSYVTREYLDEVLSGVGGSVDLGDDALIRGVSPQTLKDTTMILDEKISRIGVEGARISPIGGRYISIYIPGVDSSSLVGILGRRGSFEIRVQTEGNETAHILYGDAIEEVDIPQADQNGMWGVPFGLTQEGADLFREALIEHGATRDPRNHSISMYLDDDLLFTAPLSPELASVIDRAPIRLLQAEVGQGDAGARGAKQLYIHIAEGALPVDVEVVGSGEEALSLEANSIHGNTFRDNMAEDAYDDGNNLWDDGFMGNYYSGFNCTDDDRDGICDSIHNIKGGSSTDRYPLSIPPDGSI